MAAKKKAVRKTSKKTASKKVAKKPVTKKTVTKKRSNANAASAPKPKGAKSVEGYLAQLAPDRRAAIEALLDVVRKNADPVFEETIQYGMIGFVVPHSVYPSGYHCNPSEPLPVLSIASQARHMAIYLFCLYTDEAEVSRFVADWEKTGKKLDMGKSCVRFRSIDDLPLSVIGRAIKRATAKKFIRSYESSLAAPRTVSKKTVRKAPEKTGKKAVNKKTRSARA